MRRRTVLKGAVAATLAPLAAPAIAQPAKAATLRLIPQANLTVLDPIWTTATVTDNHGYYVFDTLYSADSTSAAAAADGRRARSIGGRPRLADPAARGAEIP